MIAKKKLYLPFIATCILASRLSAYGQAVETFKDVLSFVDQHSKLVVLSNASGASVAVWPQEQGRILTSAISPEGQSFGWVNRELIASGKVRAHINALGGEDRLWLGPEGGQYSLFFAPGSKFDLDHWFTPAAFDTEAFTVAGQTRDSIAMTKEVELTNYSGTHFKVLVQRKVHLLPAEKVWQDLGLTPVKGIRMVAYQSDNKLTNLAAQAMEKKTGVLSLWVLGQFNAAPAATIVLPFRPGDEAELGVPVKTDYFGPVPADRIRVGSNVAFFKADAGYRSKLGVNPRRSRGTIGSYDPGHHLLTIVQYDQQPQADYVNSAWEIQKEPYRGDVANCYNDGAPAPGKAQLGHFFELESSSPAVALAPHASVSHYQRTIHLVGREEDLDTIAVHSLGVHLNEVTAFNHP